MALRTASLILTKPRPKLTLRLPAYAIVSAPQPAQVLAGYTKGEKGDKGDTGERGVDGLQGPPGVPAVWVGDYDPASAYAANDAVTHLGASWVSVSSVAPGNPPPGAGWVQIAAKGDTGPKGDKGDTGATGAKGDTGPAGAALAISGPDAGSIFGIWVGSTPPPDPRWLWARATTSQIGTILEAVAGELGLAGFPPSVVGAILATGDLGLVGQVAGGSGLMVPPTGAMGLTAYAPWVGNPNSVVIVPAALLGLGAYSPTLAGVIATALATDTRLVGFAPAGLGTIPPPAGVAALDAYAPTIAPPAAGITRVGVSAVVNNSTTVPIPGPVLAGDIILVFTTSTVLGSDGYTAKLGTTQPTINPYWKRAVGGETTATLDSANANTLSLSVVYRGCIATGDPFEVGFFTGTSTGTTATAGPTTTTAKDMVLFGAVFYTADSAQTTIPSASWNTPTSSTGDTLAALSQGVNTATAIGGQRGLALYEAGVIDPARQVSCTASFAGALDTKQIKLGSFALKSA